MSINIGAVNKLLGECNAVPYSSLYVVLLNFEGDK